MKCYIDLKGEKITVTISKDSFDVDNKKHEKNMVNKKPYFDYIVDFLNLKSLKVTGVYAVEDDFFYVTHAEDLDNNTVSLKNLPSIKYRIIDRDSLFVVEYNPFDVLELDKTVRKDCHLKRQFDTLTGTSSKLENDGIVVVNGKTEYKPMDVPLKCVLTDNILKNIFDENTPKSATEFYNIVKDKLKDYSFKATEIKKLTNRFYKNESSSSASK